MRTIAIRIMLFIIIFLSVDVTQSAKHLIAHNFACGGINGIRVYSTQMQIIFSAGFVGHQKPLLVIGAKNAELRTLFQHNGLGGKVSFSVGVNLTEQWAVFAGRRPYSVNGIEYELKIIHIIEVPLHLAYFAAVIRQKPRVLGIPGLEHR